MQDVVQLSALLARTLVGRNRKLRHLVLDSPEIVIFGSSAAGLRRRDSDLDVLCLGPTTSHLKESGLDLLILSRADSSRPEWLHGELASHIARYGVWLTPTADWVREAHLGKSAVHAKKVRLEAYANALASRWDHLGEIFKRKYVTKLRRETQRFLSLRKSIAIPPTALLDRAWLYDPGAREEVVRTLSDLFRASGQDLSNLEARIRADRDPHTEVPKSSFAAAK